MSQVATQQPSISPKAQAFRDYQQGGGLDCCPAEYNAKQQECYKWEMHRLQCDEFERELEKMKHGDQ